MIRVVAAACALVLGCGRDHAAASADVPAAQRDASAPRADDELLLRGGDFIVPIFLSRQNTCVLYARSPIEGPRCVFRGDRKSDEQTRSLESDGALFVLLSATDTGALTVGMTLHAQTHRTAVDRKAFARTFVEGGLVENQSKAASVPLSANVVAERFSFDFATPQTELAMVRMVVLAIPGRRGLYSMTWTTNRARAEEAEASADRTLDTLRRSTLR